MRNRSLVLGLAVSLLLISGCIDFDDGGPDPNNEFPTDTIDDQNQSLRIENAARLIELG